MKADIKNMPGAVRGVVSHNTPDRCVRPEERGLFSGPAHKDSENVEAAKELKSGPEGLVSWTRTCAMRHSTGRR